MRSVKPDPPCSLALLSTDLPVPVSAKFPRAWARNERLQIGDHLYTFIGSKATIAAFSEILTNDVYAVTFDDGQVVKAAGSHPWKASSNSSRNWCRSAARNESGEPALRAALEASKGAMDSPLTHAALVSLTRPA